MDLMYLLHALLRKKWIILFCTALGIVAGFVFIFFKPKTYVSYAQYSTGFTMDKKVSIKEEAALNIYEIDLRFNNVFETFKSPKVMGMLSYKLLLHDLEAKNPFRVLSEEQKSKDAWKLANVDRVKDILRSKISKLELISPYVPDEKRVFDLINLYGYDDKNLTKAMTFARVERTDFINISFASESALLSAYVVNTIGDQFIRFFNTIYGSRVQESTAKLDSLTSSKKAEVDALTEKLKGYKERIGTPNVADRASNAMSVVQELTSNYQQEQAKLNDLRGDLEAVENQLKELVRPSNVPTNNNTEILRLRKENEDLELQKAGKSEDEGRRLQTQIEANLRKMQTLTPSTDRQKKLERNQTKETELIDKKIELTQKIIAAERNVRLFQTERDTYVKITESGGGEEVILNAKEGELRIASQEYEQLKKGLQASLDLDVNPENNFKLTMLGQPAYRPESAKGAMILALCGVLMFVLSSLIIVGVEFLDSSLKTPSIFQRMAKLKLLSSLNRIDLKKKDLKDYFHANGTVDRVDEGNLFVEHMRKLRYELENSGKKIFLVTSTKEQEGKTTVIEALANSFSLTKKKVLIIDANFSNNTLTQKFEAKPTLEQFSVNGTNAVDKFLHITSTTTIPNTDLVGCAKGNYTPSEILPKNNLFESISAIAGRYDFVFIEGAAINVHADSKELSRYAEGIIAVFSAKSVLKQADKDSIHYLKTTGEKFTGAVLNLVETDSIVL